MCWNSIDKNRIKVEPKVHCLSTKEDIIVYKIGFISDDKFRPYYCKYFPYEPNSIEPEIKLNLCGDGIIAEGYHSYSEDCYLTKIFRYMIMISNNNDMINDTYYLYPYYDMCIDKFIIPKGSEYYENDLGEIVSSQIMWTGESCLLDDFELTNIICDNKVYLKDLNYVLDDK